MMEKLKIWVIYFSIILFVTLVDSEEDNVKRSLITFLQKLSPANPQIIDDLKWNVSTDPCIDKWNGIFCNTRGKFVQKVNLNGLSLDGFIDITTLCSIPSLTFISVQNNNIQGNLSEDISNCSELTHLLFNGNRLSGTLPSSISSLKNLKRFDISNNNFLGEVPEELGHISGLLSFLVQNNRLNGSIPEFDFSNLKEFNVSNNLFTGPIPDGGDKFKLDSYIGNSNLCGKPVKFGCPSLPETSKKPKFEGKKKLILFSGYILLALLVLLFIAYVVFRRKKSNEYKSKNTTDDKKKESSTSSGKTGTRSEYSISSNGSAVAASSMSLVVLKKNEMKELKFEELLKAPAELLGRSRFGSLYRVMISNGSVYAVKRIKDWTVSAEEFQRRMERLDRVKHERILSAIAFYCSKQEKLVVYEYMPNGSLFKLLHGSEEGAGTKFDWSSRLNAAAYIADALAFMHKDLYEVGICHGNLKSSNILLNNSMEPCISEYGILAIPKQNASDSDRKSVSPTTDFVFKEDIYSFGVILLELLTGKVVQNNGFDLAQWVNSVVREEWTVEVFDKNLMAEGVEESMVRLLQVALKCVDSSVDARPNMKKIVKMIYLIKEDEEKSTVSEIESKENGNN